MRRLLAQPSVQSQRYGHCCLKTAYDQDSGWKSGSAWTAYGAFYRLDRSSRGARQPPPPPPPPARPLPPTHINPSREQTFSTGFGAAMQSNDKTEAIAMISDYYNDGGGGGGGG